MKSEGRVSLIPAVSRRLFCLLLFFAIHLEVVRRVRYENNVLKRWEALRALEMKQKGLQLFPLDDERQS